LHNGHSLAATAATRRHSRNRQGCRVFFPTDLSISGTPDRISKQNVAIRGGTGINLVLKFQVDRASFHGEEASDRKRRKMVYEEEEQEEEKESIEHS